MEGKNLTAKEISRFLSIDSRMVRWLFDPMFFTERTVRFSENTVVARLNRAYKPANIYNGKIKNRRCLSLTEKFLLPSNVENKLCISKATLSRYREDRRIGFVQLTDRTIRYPELDIQEFLQNNHAKALTYED
ncbi:hypothetical protein [Leptospira santarosai]|uniref:DNA-binding protein n=1 Tax=Leptospira santarosai str. MOR084 TaxID=1049984 RepID=A0A0E2BVU8_9LEPT|nr:hypothetical protein [Leptospira santarosai]EKO35693.1 hypothetical protein LEP1GSC179_1209 [Leptospira santarosai str. MOR084]